MTVKNALVGLVMGVLACVTGYALWCFRATDPSLWYVDSAVTVSWFAWLRACYAGGLLRLLGFGAWVLPLVCAHAAGTILLHRWRDEWDRCAALVTLLFTTSIIFVLAHGMLWRGQFIDGGLVGRWLVHHMLPHDRILAWTLTVALAFCALIITARLSFVLVVRYLWRGLVWLVSMSSTLMRWIQVSAHAVRVACVHTARGVRWLYHLLTGKPARDDASLLLADEHAEQMPTLASIVHDTVWQTYTQSPPEPIESIAARVDASDFDQTSYQLPKLVAPAQPFEHVVDSQALHDQARVLEHKLASFGIQGQVTDVAAGPLIACFSYQPSVDTKLSRITALEDDLALALQATSLRVLAPIPGTAVVGFEVAHKQRHVVSLASLLATAVKDAQALAVVLGVDSVGTPVVVDLTRMPHLLIAGATGSGKSVALHSILISLLCRCSPDELKLVLIDPKRIELRSYTDLAHLACPIITEPSGAVRTIAWLVETMEQRYAWLAQKGARSITDYHARYGKQGRLDMPFMVVVIDELADLMMSTRDRIEPGLVRLAQMARAAGIHLIVATQRPSVDVITGLIKVNFVSRIALRVTSAIDSRIIIDVAGAEKLLGYGDLLMVSPGTRTPVRVHGAYVTDDEIEQVCAHIRAQRAVVYETMMTAAEPALVDGSEDELYGEVVQLLHEIDEVSISLIQRRFRIGFNRSARIIERLEGEGKITPPAGGKTRKVVRS